MDGAKGTDENKKSWSEMAPQLRSFAKQIKDNDFEIQTPNQGAVNQQPQTRNIRQNTKTQADIIINLINERLAVHGQPSAAAASQRAIDLGHPTSDTGNRIAHDSKRSAH